MMFSLCIWSRVNRDILPERTWGAANSQVPSKFFCGEGPQLAWGEESAKHSGRVCDAPQGESVLDASMMAELIVSKKEIVPQLKESARNLADVAEKSLARGD